MEMDQASEDFEEARKRFKAAEEKLENSKKTFNLAKKRVIFLVSDSLKTNLGI
jgi:exonuclease VII small subunit